MNIVFVASRTQYDCTNQNTVATDAYTSNRTLFQQDVSNLISDNYLSLDQYTSAQIGLPSDYKSRFNFYYYWDKNDFADAFKGCSGTLPDHFWENAPFADVAVIVYPTYTGMYTGTCQPDGCASGLGPGTHTWVKIPADGGKLSCTRAVTRPSGSSMRTAGIPIIPRMTRIPISGAARRPAAGVQPAGVLLHASRSPETASNPGGVGLLEAVLQI